MELFKNDCDDLSQPLWPSNDYSIIILLFSLENPFVRTDSNKTVTAFLGDNVTMIFLAARDSDGHSNELSSLQGYFVADNGSNSIFKVNQNCGNNDESICYQYRYSINKIRPQQAGVYYAGLTCMLPKELSFILHNVYYK